MKRKKNSYKKLRSIKSKMDRIENIYLFHSIKSGLNKMIILCLRILTWGKFEVISKAVWGLRIKIERKETTETTKYWNPLALYTGMNPVEVGGPLNSLPGNWKQEKMA